MKKELQKERELMTTDRENGEDTVAIRNEYIESLLRNIKKK